MDMERIYDGDRVVGHVEAKREGMYYLLKCTCCPISGKPERITLCTDQDRQIDLGLCIPEGKEMTLVKRVHRGDVDDRRIRYIISNSLKRDSVQIKTGMVFEWIEKLPDAKLLWENGMPKIVFKDQSSSNPTGQ